MDSPDKDEVKEKHRLSEGLVGIVICIIAAIAAVTSVFSGRAAYEWLYTSQKSAEVYSWYQAKSIKDTLLEGQANLIISLVKSNPQSGTQNNNFLEDFLNKLQSERARLDKEQTEILKGSAKVGEENWSQDIDGKLGQVVGANEWRTYSYAFGEAADTLDRATMYLQLSLVVGAVCLLMSGFTMRLVFFISMIMLSLVGISYFIQGYTLFKLITY